MRYFKFWTGAVGLTISFLALQEGQVWADSASLAPFSQDAPVQPSTIQVDGKDAQIWQTSVQDKVLTFKLTGTPLAPVSGTLYLEVVAQKMPVFTPSHVDPRSLDNAYFQVKNL